MMELTHRRRPRSHQEEKNKNGRNNGINGEPNNNPTTLVVSDGAKTWKQEEKERKRRGKTPQSYVCPTHIERTAYSIEKQQKRKRKWMQRKHSEAIAFHDKHSVERQRPNYEFGFRSRLHVGSVLCGTGSIADVLDLRTGGTLPKVCNSHKRNFEETLVMRDSNGKVVPNEEETDSTPDKSSSKESSTEKRRPPILGFDIGISKEMTWKTYFKGIRVREREHRSRVSKILRDVRQMKFSRGIGSDGRHGYGTRSGGGKGRQKESGSERDSGNER